MFGKCGYEKEAFLRHSVYKNGELHNQYIWSILRSEFDQLVKTKKIEWSERIILFVLIKYPRIANE